MNLSGKRLLVTGGAGFIGVPLVERLVADNDVVVVDDLSNGTRAAVPDGARFREADLTDPAAAESVVDSDLDAVFHLAAADKYVDSAEPREQFAANTGMTHPLLEALRGADVRRVAFTSSSTVYGEAPRPTPEDYPPEPISVYGAAKLAEEGLLSTYARSHDFTVWNFRFANIVGPRLRGAVIPDFVEKLREDPETLTILGDGRQEKSYMHVEDCVDAMNTYNLGTRTTTSVNRIADIVAEEMGLDPDYEYTGGDRGWTGDVPKMRLSIETLAALGWEPDLESDASVRRSARELVAELQG